MRSKSKNTKPRLIKPKRKLMKQSKVEKMSSDEEEAIVYRKMGVRSNV